MSYLIQPWGEKQKATPKNGVAFTVAELQDYVDGFIGLEDVEDGIIVFDENGGEDDKLYNPVATQMVWDYNPHYQGFIAGTALVCRRDEIRL